MATSTLSTGIAAQTTKGIRGWIAAFLVLHGSFTVLTASAYPTYTSDGIAGGVETKTAVPALVNATRSAAQA